MTNNGSEFKRSFEESKPLAINDVYESAGAKHIHTGRSTCIELLHAYQGKFGE